MATMIHESAAAWSPSLAQVAIGATGVALVALAALHVASPEFAPSWRMVSEYANGRYGWLLSIFFAAWAAGTWSLAAALWPLSATTLGRVGLAFLVLAGVGEMMAAFFDINHRLHGPAAMIGIPSLAVAAVLVSIAIARRGDIAAVPAWSAHLPWVSIVLMTVSMGLFMSSLSRAGVDLGAQSAPLTALPSGVIALAGWANRVLVVSYCVWVILAARSVARAGG